MTLSAAEGRLLAGTPLHAITSDGREAGLSEGLALEIAGSLPGERTQVKDALALARRSHASDRRQREPYVNRVLRLAIRILTRYSVNCRSSRWGS